MEGQRRRQWGREWKVVLKQDYLVPGGIWSQLTPKCAMLHVLSYLQSRFWALILVSQF
jgi:hypothetical protein